MNAPLAGNGLVTDAHLARDAKPARPGASDARLAQLLLFAMWSGLVTGYSEVLARFAGKVILGKTVHLDPNFVWMAPVADLLLFLLVAALMIALTWWYSRAAACRAVVFATTTLLLLTLLYSYPAIHWAASLALAVGVGVQTARIAGARFALLMRAVRATFPVLAGATVVIMVALPVARSLSRQRAFAALTPARPNAPNIVFIILDTVRAASTSTHGYSRPTTPTLQRFSLGAVRFDRAFATAPWTLPSHGSFFTGRYPHELSTDWERALDRTYPTIAEVLRERGYRTRGLNANYLYGGAEFGLGRGFIQYEAYPVNVGQLAASSRMARLANGWSNRIFHTYRTLGRRHARAVTDRAIGWIRKDDGPFFLFLNYFDAHEPYAPPAPYDLLFLGRRPEVRHVLTGKRHTPAQVRDLRDAYDGAIAYIDNEIGRLFDALTRAGLTDNTIIIVTSDHGEEFGEHGYMSHGNGLYAQSLQVPLLIAYPPRVPVATSVKHAVTLRDIPATIVDLAAVQTAQMPGQSLARFWSAGSSSDELGASPVLSELNDVANQPSWYPIAGGALRSIIVGDRHYIVRKDGREELYDLARDPAEQHNLAPLPAHARVLDTMRVALRSSVRTQP